MTRREMLAQAQRNLDLADLLVSNGKYQAARENITAAYALIFCSKQHPTAQPEVAAHRKNTGSCGEPPQAYTPSA